MSKMIDGNKLILTLSDWWYSNFGLEETEESKAIHKVLDEIERYVEHEKSAGEWIPVSEGLPKEGEPVLITDCGYVDGLAWVAKDGAWESDHAYTDSVTAWMPLPEPYKGGDDE